MIKVVKGHNPETKFDVDVLLPFFPYFGDFALIDLRVHDQDDDGILISGTTYGPSEEQMKEMNQYLVGYGFAERRYDIDEKGFRIQLTDRGRKLKDAGSLYKFKRNHLREKAASAFQEQMAVYGFWITFSIGISTFCAALYYGLEIHSHHKNAYSEMKHYGMYLIPVVALIILLRFLIKLQQTRQSQNDKRSKL